MRFGYIAEFGRFGNLLRPTVRHVVGKVDNVPVRIKLKAGRSALFVIEQQIARLAQGMCAQSIPDNQGPVRSGNVIT
ncbi:hypothetical protein D3C74_366240 [compost metagenome]